MLSGMSSNLGMSGSMTALTRDPLPAHAPPAKLTCRPEIPTPIGALMPRARSALDVLALHQFPEVDGGGCTGPGCSWGLAANAGDDNRQMAEHQLEVLAEEGFKVTR